MPDAPDHFARKSVARVWSETRELTRQVDGMLDRLSAIEPRALRHMQRCTYCGEWSLAPVCRSHADLLEVDNLAPSLGDAA